MKNYEDVIEFVRDEDIRFIRLTFFDVFGNQKNIAVMPGELERVLEEGIAVDPNAVAGFENEDACEILLRPDPDTLSLIPWRSVDGGVIRLFCDIAEPDGSPFEKDSRYILKKAISAARERGIRVLVGPELEFYIFKRDENGKPTKEPQDTAGYLDVFPKDKGEDIRRDICNTLIDMNVSPESSHHEQGPGQNEVDFRYSDPLAAADNTATLKWIVQNVAWMHGYCANFSPRPLRDKPGNGMHIHISVESDDGYDYTDAFMAGVMKHIKEMTLFLNPDNESYERLGKSGAPGTISWSAKSRDRLIRIPAPRGGKKRFELRSPDVLANPYLTYALIIRAGLDGVEKEMELMPESVSEADISERLPESREEALAEALGSDFIRSVLPECYIKTYGQKG